VFAYALVLAIGLADFALAFYDALHAPFPLRVSMGAPTAYLNIYLHVPMAWASYVLYTGAFVSALLYLIRGGEKLDYYVRAFVTIASIYAIFTLVSGMAWASESWGAAWNWDPRETAVLLLLLAYLVYFVLRGSIPDPDRASSLSAAYAVAAYSMVPVSFIAPRLVESLHPTSKSFGSFMARPEVLKLFVPRVVFATVIALLFTYIAALKLRGQALNPKWARLAALLFIALGLSSALLLAHPYFTGSVDRVVNAKVKDGRVLEVTLAGGGRFVFDNPVSSPIKPAVLDDGTPSIVSNLVTISDNSIEVVRHWSVAFNLAAYATIIGSVFLYLSRPTARGG